MQLRIRQVSFFAVVFVASFNVLGVGALAQSNNPHLGTWTANIAKSKATSGAPLKSGTTKIESAGAGVKVTVDGVYADGTTRHWGYTANYDGKDTRVVGDGVYGDTVALTRVDAFTVRTVNKQGGKITATQTSVVAKDGKSRTLTTTGTNRTGEKIDNVTVYDKQ
jgi:hypothetical protein